MPGVSAYFSSRLSFFALTRTTTKQFGLPARSIAVARLGPMWHRVDGVAAALSREDAIDATAVSLTRRDGPDAVRMASNSKKKPPPASCDGHDLV